MGTATKVGIAVVGVAAIGGLAWYAKKRRWI
jgi:LPXTG-motif cell wall-anchored protein